MAKAREIAIDPGEPFAVAARRVVSVRAAELFDHAENVLDTGDVERLADALGERRDPDVHIAEFTQLRAELAEADHPGVDLLLESLREEQARGNEHLAAALEQARESDLPGRLAALARPEPEPEP